MSETFPASLTVLVTGGTTRLGLAIATRLRACGHRVLTTSHRAEAGADVVADFAAPGGAVRAYAKALDILGGRPPDALVNNAALFSGPADVLRAVNVEAPRKLTVLMGSREAGIGCVVNVIDSRALGPRGADAAGPFGYAETKAALLDQTRELAAAFVATLRVNAVAPGPVIAPEGVRERAGETPLGRPTPADVADAVAFLISARSVSGAVLPVDGGQHLVA